MSVRLRIARLGVIGGAIFFGIKGDCLAWAEDGPPTPAVAAPVNDESNPYSVITGRNVFHLNPPPPPPAPDTGLPPALPEVYLSGFMRMGDILKVLMEVKTRNPEARGPELISYLTLAEGEKEGVVELVRVYLDQEKVDIINSGTPMTLSMKDNGVKGEAPSPPPPPLAASAAASRRPARQRPPLLRRDLRGHRLDPQPTGGAPGPDAAPADAAPGDGENASGTMPPTP